ncbi:hypothetical protein ACHAXH_003712 [Discostella pseudostelligera]
MTMASAASWSDRIGVIKSKPLHSSHRHERHARRRRHHPCLLVTTLLAVMITTSQLTTPVRAQQQSSSSSSSYSTIDGFSCFRNMDGMMQSMFDLADAYPHLASITDIGDSYMKYSGGGSNANTDLDVPTEGYDIYAMNITFSGDDDSSSSNQYLSTTDSKGRLLITSGMHAREIAPPELTMRLAEHILESYGTDSDITWLLHHTEIHIIFYVNPDGRYIAENYQYLEWRKNGDDQESSCSYGLYGVDINRNFDFVWGDLNGSSDDPCMDDYHGLGPESEPETQAIVNYARALFPESQRKNDPESEKDVPLGDDIMGMYVDIHAEGGYVYYPWGHEDLMSPDDDALQALGRKIASFNDYKLWAPGSPDFLYPAAGDSSDYAYGVLGVASFGLELGKAHYEDCDLFEGTILPTNRDALIYAAKLAKKPFSLVKGPDIIDLNIEIDSDDVMTLIAVASDSQMVNGLHSTGDQDVTKVQLYVDVHPDDYADGDVTFEMTSGEISGFQTSFMLESNLPSSVGSGRHMLFAQAIDSDGSLGPVKSVFFDVDRVVAVSESPTQSPIANALESVPTKAPTVEPTHLPSSLPTPTHSSSPSALPSYQISTSPSSDPTIMVSSSPSNQPSNSPSYVQTTPRPTPMSLSIDTTLKPSPTTPTLDQIDTVVASAAEAPSSGAYLQAFQLYFLFLPVLIYACL